MTENIFNAGEIIESLKSDVEEDISYIFFKENSDTHVHEELSKKITLYTKAIIEITLYERETVTYGKTCRTCYSKDTEEYDNPCNKCLFTEWQPRITKATYGLE